MSGFVDIVIVNWNSGAWLKTCLASIVEHGGSALGAIVVIDNGSTDGSADLDFAPLDVQIVKTGQNLGFGAACNLGVSRTTAPYILFLNPDAGLLPGTLDQAVAYMERDDAAQVGACGVQLIGSNGDVQRHCARFPTWQTFVGGSFGLTEWLPGRFPPLLMLEFDHLSERDVDHVIGAFYLVRRSLFQELKGFDQRFFVYLEDLDLSRRIRDRGLRIHYLPQAKAFHKGGGTSEKVKSTRLFYSLRSRLAYADKHFTRSAACAVLAATLIVEPISRLTRAILRLSPTEFVDTCRGFAMLYRDIAKSPPLSRSAVATGASSELRDRVS